MRQLLKLLLIAVCVGTCMLVVVGIIAIFTESWYPVMSGILMVKGAIVTLIGAIIIVQKIEEHRYQKETKKWIQEIEGLRKAGLLSHERYRAVRAFMVEELEFDEGSKYFIELKDRRVLFLCGQYLWDYEPLDDGDSSVPRRFPCAEFEVVRHPSTREGLDIVCHGAVIEPECTAPPFTEAEFKSGKVPQDGDIIADRSYDTIKAERLR